MTAAKKLTLCVAVVIIFLPVLIIGRCEYKSRSFTKGFNNIKVGDSRETVVELMSDQDPGEVPDEQQRSYEDQRSRAQGSRTPACESTGYEGSAGQGRNRISPKPRPHCCQPSAAVTGGCS